MYPFAFGSLNTKNNSNQSIHLNRKWLGVERRKRPTDIYIENERQSERERNRYSEIKIEIEIDR